MSADSNPRITPEATVTLHFSLALDNGEIIDSNFDRTPATFRIGDGSMLPGFEAELLGLGPGDELEKTLPSSQAFGAVNPGNIHRFPIARFKPLLEDELTPMEPGAVVAFKDGAGLDLPGVISAVDEREVEVDFNHPLAGRDIVFRVKIIAVLPAGTDNLTLKV